MQTLAEALPIPNVVNESEIWGIARYVHNEFTIWALDRFDGH